MSVAGAVFYGLRVAVKREPMCCEAERGKEFPFAISKIICQRKKAKFSVFHDGDVLLLDTE